MLVFDHALNFAQRDGFSALQRAEIAEIAFLYFYGGTPVGRFSALQRAEIAEIILRDACAEVPQQVSVLFNEPKLLKCSMNDLIAWIIAGFQCSSTSRNC